VTIEIPAIPPCSSQLSEVSLQRPERLAAFDAAATPLVTPSLLNCDFARVGDALRELERAGVEAVHLDVMDGHFVPNLTYGPPLIKDWRSRTNFPFDAHLMISDPATYLDAFIDAGCDLIIVHIEVLPDPVPLLQEIQAKGCRACLTLNPPTPVERVLPFLDQVDGVLVMSVMPGFGGQTFDPSALGKLRRLRAERPDLRLSIDGGIKARNAREAVAAGANQLVVGSAIFRDNVSVAQAFQEIVQAAGTNATGDASRHERGATGR
jgi:ribulose-phosphate 3-epimerase